MAEELNKNERALAGTLLILFTILPAFFIIAFWPNRMPDPQHPQQTSYHFKFFHVKLITDSTGTNVATIKNAASISSDSAVIPKPDGQLTAEDSTAKKTAAFLAANDKTKGEITAKLTADTSCIIDINIILLLLVAIAGFLGNMIHVATSITTFIGAEQFKRSWILWYYVKPFSATALALILYFVFRAGFLTMNNDPSSINLYGVMTLSVLAGLFTDKATQKLKEIFEVVFRSKEERPDKLEPTPKVKKVSPGIISAGIENVLTLSGENLDLKFNATINDEPVTVSGKTKETATITYKIPATQQGKTEFILLVSDDKDHTLLREVLKLNTVEPA